MSNWFKRQDAKSLLCYMFGVIVACGLALYKKDMEYLSDRFDRLEASIETEGANKSRVLASLQQLLIAELEKHRERILSNEFLSRDNANEIKHIHKLLTALKK